MADERLISADACLATIDLVAIARPQEPAASANMDALAASLASQANAFSYGAFLLAALVSLLGFAWGLWVKRMSERKAKEEAQALANRLLREWLVKSAPAIIAEHVTNILDSTAGPEDDEQAADSYGGETD